MIAKAAGMAFSDFSGLNTDEECADAIIAALAAEGMVIVPKVPTQAMIDRATASHTWDDPTHPDASPDHDYDEDTARVWRQMIIAAHALPTPTLPPAGDDT